VAALSVCNLAVCDRLSDVNGEYILAAYDIVCNACDYETASGRDVQSGGYKYDLAGPTAGSRPSERYVLLLFLIYFIVIFEGLLSDQLSQNLPDQSLPNFRIGRTVAVYGRFGISFSIPRGMLPGQPFFLVLSTQLRRMCVSVTTVTQNVCFCDYS